MDWKRQIDVLGCACCSHSQFHGVTPLQQPGFVLFRKQARKQSVKGNLPAQTLEINAFGSLRRFQTRLKGHAERSSSGILAWLIVHADIAFDPRR